MAKGETMKKNRHDILKILKKKRRKKRSYPHQIVRNKTPLGKKRMKRLLLGLKNPSILLIASLMLIILMIPSLIVILFKNEETHSQEDVDKRDDVPTEKEDDDDSLSVSIMRTESDQVEDIPLETYVRRVVASEMPAEFEMEALKAQSLAARTYIINYLLHDETADNPEVTDGTEHQVYKDDEELRREWGSDYHWKMEKLVEAVEATEGEILTYEDDPITPAYFSTSNGYTENSEDYWEQEIPYLRSVKSPWDEQSPQFVDQQVFTLEDVENALNIQLQDETNISLDVTRTDSERVEQLIINEHELSGRDVREKLDLQSTDFTVEQKNNHLIFTTKGFGHGVGMSQYGANGMAKEGKSYEDIVKYYYKDVEVSTLNDAAPTLVAR